MTITTLVNWLEAIAKKNNDRFDYRITVNPLRNGLVFTFECRENHDKHVFLAGDGSSVEEACTNAMLEIASACEDWGYAFVPLPTATSTKHK